MENDASLQASRKKPPPGKAIVVALLGLHGLFLIIIGLIAFFGGFVGVYDVSHGHTTPGATCGCSGSCSGVDFSPGWDCFLSLRAGVVDVAALGTLVDDWPGAHQSDCGFLRAETAAFRPVDYYCEHEYCRRDPPLCTDSDRSSHAFPSIMRTRNASQATVKHDRLHPICGPRF